MGVLALKFFLNNLRERFFQHLELEENFFQHLELEERFQLVFRVPTVRYPGIF